LVEHLAALKVVHLVRLWAVLRVDSSVLWMADSKAVTKERRMADMMVGWKVARKDCCWVVHSVATTDQQLVEQLVVAREYRKVASKVDCWVAKRGTRKAGHLAVSMVVKKVHWWVESSVAQKDCTMAVSTDLLKADS
jgi:phosphopantetheine adenylyltransferase